VPKEVEQIIDYLFIDTYKLIKCTGASGRLIVLMAVLYVQVKCLGNPNIDDESIDCIESL